MSLTSFYFVLIHFLSGEFGLFISTKHAGEIKISHSPLIVCVFKLIHFMH